MTLSHTIAWFSGGATSAIACKIAIEKYENVKVVYIETGTHHEDAPRFLNECSEWFKRPIETIQSQKYKSVDEVLRKRRFINSATGSICTSELKRNVRVLYQKQFAITHQVWGFEYEPKEINRAKRIETTNAGYKNLFPLIEEKITKPNCLEILQNAGISSPAMYLLGYQNANCVGCVKGGMAYWNKIRCDFPQTFARMAALEREINRSCLKKYFLDELPVAAGRGEPPLVPSCGGVGEGCEIESARWFSTKE